MKREFGAIRAASGYELANEIARQSGEATEIKVRSYSQA